MGKNTEEYINKVYETVKEMKIPLVDDKVYDGVKSSGKEYGTEVTFKYEGDEEVIMGFLGLAQYFKTLIIRKKDTFLIPTDCALFVLED